jgi:hypothetical protein
VVAVGSLWRGAIACDMDKNPWFVRGVQDKRRRASELLLTKRVAPLRLCSAPSNSTDDRPGTEGPGSRSATTKTSPFVVDIIVTDPSGSSAFSPPQLDAPRQPQLSSPPSVLTFRTKTASPVPRGAQAFFPFDTDPVRLKSGPAEETIEFWTN